MNNGLLELHTTTDPALRRSLWRATLASLAQACSYDVPGPLDGLPSASLAEGVTLALADGLADDLSFLPQASAAAALYELASVLPKGEARAALERRVAERLQEGDAATFVAVVTRMGLGSGAPSGEGVRARVALCAALPPSSGVRVDRLALSLLSRRESSRAWVDEPSRGSLPDRRMAARLLEQAAWAIARQVSQGDDWPLRLLRGEAFGATMPRLLADREALVMRHAAIARGLLARFHAPYQAAIDAGLRTGRGPTEWRRAGASLAALAAFDPDGAVERLRAAIAQGVLRSDPGAAASLCWGAAAAGEAEPEAAGAILSMVAEASPLPAAEAIVGIDGAHLPFAREAVEKARAALEAAVERSDEEVDDGKSALHEALLEELRGVAERPVGDSVQLARKAFVEQGAKAALAMAREALDQADGGVATLDLLDAAEDDSPSGAEVRRRAFVVLRDIQAGLLHDGVLDDLVQLERREVATPMLSELTRVRDRVAAWVMEREGHARGRTHVGGEVAHLTLRLSQLRTLLYAADARTAADASQALASARARRQRIAALMLRRLSDGAAPALRRATCATLARAIDALVRGGDLDPADVCLVAAQLDLAEGEIAVIAEASANADVSAMLQAFLSVVRSAPGEAAGGRAPSLPQTRRAPGISSGSSLPPLSPYGQVGERLQVLLDFARLIDADASSRTEAFRTALLRFGKALAALLAGSTLAELTAPGEGGDSSLAALDAAVPQILQLCAGAELRVGLKSGAVVAQTRPLAPAIAAAVGQGKTEAAMAPLLAAQQELEQALPPSLASLASGVLARLASLPLGTRPLGKPGQTLPPREAPLPPWIPPHRTLGGFYVLSPIGSGGAGSVFIVRRVEDRHDARAERFALKVPEYEGSAARSLSEAEFMQLFREEATALLGLPHHPNLARFVTFDLAARPKPILVMELVEGVALDHLLEARALDTERAFSLLDGVLAGLEAMHSVGVGHLDLKPGNVILRGGREPVLVDFGLAGRQVRPGCGTLSYGAPEIWLGPQGDAARSPLPVDVYAAACLAFELLTGEPLFDASSEVAAVTAHLAHDGMPERLKALWSKPGLGPLVDALRGALRRDPKNRSSATSLRGELRRAGQALARAPWPLRSGGPGAR